ncbi:MAG: MarR family transcriptional regulator [Herbiconiux sp.]|nr:MarR family transcriptional regulator [Herbiconiux sp.]
MTSSETENATSAELRTVAFRLARRLRKESADHELSPSQTAVLGYLMRHDTATPAELSAFEQVAPPSMNRTLNALQDAGYLARTPGVDDRRTVTVTLTETGRAVVAETRRRRDAWLDRRLETLSPRERDVLAEATAIIRKLTDE